MPQTATGTRADLSREIAESWAGLESAARQRSGEWDEAVLPGEPPRHVACSPRYSTWRTVSLELIRLEWHRYLLSEPVGMRPAHMIDLSATGRVPRVEHHALLRQFDTITTPTEMFTVLDGLRVESLGFMSSISEGDLELAVPFNTWSRRYMEHDGLEPSETLRGSLAHGILHVRERALHISDGRQIVRWD